MCIETYPHIAFLVVQQNERSICQLKFYIWTRSTYRCKIVNLETSLATSFSIFQQSFWKLIYENCSYLYAWMILGANWSFFDTKYLLYVWQLLNHQTIIKYFINNLSSIFISEACMCIIVLKFSYHSQSNFCASISIKWYWGQNLGYACMPYLLVYLS